MGNYLWEKQTNYVTQLILRRFCGFLADAKGLQEAWGLLWKEELVGRGPLTLRLGGLEGLERRTLRLIVTVTLSVVEYKGLKGEAQGEAGALTDDALDLHLAVVLSHDAFADGETESCTARLCGEERDEEFARICPLDPTALIVEHNLDAA